MCLLSSVLSPIHELTNLVSAQLYREYAEPYQLAEGKLAIVHCAGLHDPSLVESLWQNIVEHGNYSSLPYRKFPCPMYNIMTSC